MIDHRKEFLMHTMIERLIECRKAAGLSQTELAEKLGLSRQTISKWETGSVIPAAENLSALAKLYNVSLDWLVNGVDFAKPQTRDEEAAKAEEPVQPRKSINGWRIASFVLAALLLAVVIFGIVRYQRTVDAASVTHVEQVENPESGGFDIIWN